MMKMKKFLCPDCKQRAGVEIGYGYPSPELMEAASRGDIVLGGCCLTEEAPERECTACGHQWNIRRRGIGNHKEGPNH